MVTGSGVVSSSGRGIRGRRLNVTGLAGKIRMRGCTVVRSVAWGVRCDNYGTIELADGCTVSESGIHDYCEMPYQPNTLTGVPRSALQTEFPGAEWDDY